MALKNIAANSIVYMKGTPANEIALIIKGSVTLRMGAHSLNMGAGSLIGLSESMGAPHRFSYTAAEDVTLYTYPYGDADSLSHILKANEKLVPTITLTLIKNTTSLYSVANGLHNQAIEEYDTLVQNFHDYSDLCGKTGHVAKDFSYISKVESPDTPSEIEKWRADFFNALSVNASSLTAIYTHSTDICIGLVNLCHEFLVETSTDIAKINASIERFHSDTIEFRSEMVSITEAMSAIESGEETLQMPDMTDSLSQILLYAEYPEEESEEIKQTFNSYAGVKDRSETTDVLRGLRKKITEYFYNIYERAFLRSLDGNTIPPIVRMFLLYGYMDERLVTEEDFKSLFGFVCGYRYDGGKVISVYDWLKLVYYKSLSPSLNEYQQDYNAYLRDSKNRGDITADEMEKRLHSSTARLQYEIKNLFTLGNRMVFGRISVFSPVFDSQSKMLPLEKSRLTSENVNAEINRIRDLDYTIFYRTKIFNMPNNNSITLFIHEEQIPYVILLPVVGQKMTLWQPIEGRIRNSSARMLAPAFFDENLPDSFTRLCADYRWEVCKLEQGPRWTDITDPSLTAEFHDLLQFYKKNSSISKEHKEKIALSLKKQANNYKKVFINDYLSYIKFESAGNMRLLKYIREILFKYCPFKKETRESLLNSPQYEKLIEIRNNKLEATIRPIHNIITKAESHGDDIPEELNNELTYLNG